MTATISNCELTAIIKQNGAELISLKANATNREYIWEGNPSHWGKHAPILFPIVGTLRNNEYTYDGQNYSLSRHGFARDRVFDLVYQSENKVIFSLKSAPDTKNLFPFDFELQLVYELKNTELFIEYRVFNKDTDIMYYSIGGHPALALPKHFEEYSLLFEPNESLISYALENDLLTDNPSVLKLDQNKLFLTYPLFAKDALIFKQLKSKQITLLENELPILNFKFPDFPNFGIWTKNQAPFICLEPWVGYSDLVNASGKIEEKEGIQTLKSNSSEKYGFSIEIL